MTILGRRSSGEVAVVGSGVGAGAVVKALLGLDELVVHAADGSAPERGHDRVITHAPPGVGEDWWTPWLAACDLCLLCADVVDGRLALEVNARCLETGVPFLPGLVMGTVGQIGPLVVGGRSACLQCVDLRLRAVTGRSCLTPFGPGDAGLAAVVGEAVGGRAFRVLEEGGDPIDRRLTYVWPDGSSQDHPVLRTWHCGQCASLGPQPAFGGRSQLRHLDDERPDPALILAVADQLVDPVTGPIRSLQRFEPGPDDPALRHWVTALADPGWAALGVPIVHCGGNDGNDELSRAAALGEAVERMSVCHPLAAELPVAPYREVRADAVDPAAWDLFLAATRGQPGFPFATVAPDDPITWTWAWSLSRELAILVPASRVFVPFRARTPADHADHPAVGGSAAASSPAGAVVAAVLEVVERDAFLIAWANRLTLTRLELDASSPGGVGAYVAAFQDCGVEVRCSLLTLDVGIPVVVAMARGTRPGEPATVVAAGAGFEAAEACRHALRELAANRLNVRHALSTSPTPPTGEASDVRDEVAHGLLFSRPEMAIHLRHWWDSPSRAALPEPSPPRPPAEQLEVLIRGASAAGLEVIVVDVTPPEIRELGLAVAKALVPGAYPMSFDSRWPHLGGRRLRMAPVAAGLLDAPLPVERLNRVPHPFP